MLNYCKKLLILSLLFTNLIVFAQKKGYNIKIKIENYTNDSLFLGNYYGDKQYIKDTAIINSKGQFVFANDETLPGGVYLIITNDRRYFELIIDNEQFFSVETYNEDFSKYIKVKNSPDNEVFYKFVNYNRVKYEDVTPLQKKLAEVKDNKDSTKLIKDKLKKLNDEISDYKLQFIKDNPNHLMAKVFIASKDVDVPDAPKLPGGGIDSMFQYRYYKDHYWDNFDLLDDRILRTPVFHGRLENYFKNIIIQSNDSIMANCDDMIERTRGNKEMFKYTLWFLTSFYEKSQIMGQDEVFVYLVEKYYKTNQAFWATQSTVESLIKRIGHIKPTLIGRVPPELIMPDTNDVFVSSFAHKSHFTMILFWDTDCGHCKVEVPKIKEFYDKNKKRFDIEIYAIDTDHDLDRMKKYIRENKHTWISVSGMKTNIDYHDVYDIYSTPVIFLLDKDFKVIAKRLGIEQVEDFLQHFMDRENRNHISTNNSVKDKKEFNQFISLDKLNIQAEKIIQVMEAKDCSKAFELVKSLESPNIAERNNNNSLLMYASYFDCVNVVKLLLDKGAKVDFQDKNGATALFYASQFGHFEIVKLLLDNGANVDLQSNNGENVLMAASAKGHIEIVKLLLDRSAKIDLQAQNGFTSLMNAAQEGHTEIVKLLLNSGAKINLKNKIGYTALIYAAQEGQVEIVKLLLEKGADVDLQGTKDGANALMLASQNGYVEIVRLLLDKNTKVNLQSNEGLTSLYMSVQNGFVDIAKLLIDKGAIVNQQLSNGATALMVASALGNVEMVKLLLSNGADPDIKAKNGETALDFAEKKEIKDLLIQKK